MAQQLLFKGCYQMHYKNQPLPSTDDEPPKLKELPMQEDNVAPMLEDDANYNLLLEPQGENKEKGVMMLKSKLSRSGEGRCCWDIT
jgi:hypothetical protein